jgi:hypothetical protein
MKNILFFAFVFLFFIPGFAQDTRVPVSLPDSLKQNTGASSNRLLGCPGWASHGYCNLLFVNNQFTVSPGKPMLTNPFPTMVQGWTSSHGTPQVNALGAPAASLQLPAGTNYASMWASGGNGEGIVGNIPDAYPNGLNVGQPFILSFYRRVLADPRNPTPQLDRIRIVLLNCNDTLQFPGNAGNLTPPIPSTAQVIYCENDAHIGVDRVVVQFTPNAQYNLIWIFPDQVSTPGQAWLDIAFPQIFDANLYDGPRTWDNTQNAYYLGDHGVVAMGGMANQLCHEVNTLGEWINSSNSVVWSLTTLGSNYDVPTCPYDNNCGPLYGPIYPNSGNPQTFTFRETFLNAVVTNNTCSAPVLSRTSSPVLIRHATAINKREDLPNPKENNIQVSYDRAASNVNIRIAAASEEQLSIVVFDQQGKLISRDYTAKVQKGLSDHLINVPHVSAGIYFAKIMIGSKKYSYKFVVD